MMEEDMMLTATTTSCNTIYEVYANQYVPPAPTFFKVDISKKVKVNISLE